MKQRFFRSATGRGVFAAGLLVLLALCGVFSLTAGAVSIPWQDWNMNNIILREIRLPRTILGIFTGAVFAVSGAILQGIMRNPLASPGILGVSAGGGLAGLLALLAFPGIIPLLPAVSFAGSFLAAILVYRSGTSDPFRGGSFRHAQCVFQRIAFVFPGKSRTGPGFRYRIPCDEKLCRPETVIALYDPGIDRLVPIQWKTQYSGTGR